MPYADPEKQRQYAAEYARKRRARLKAAGTYVPYRFSPEQRERANARQRDRAAARRAEPGYTRAGELRRLKAQRYGMAPDVFEDWFQSTFSAQGGACAICRTTFLAEAPARRGGAAGVPYVDHDHTTGQVRGLLCTGCNVLVGFLEKDPARATAATEYVLRHTEKALDSGWPDD